MPLSISSAYQFCSRCGHAVKTLDDLTFIKCHHCQHTHHFNPITAVGVIIYGRDGQVLLIRRSREPGKGKLGLPGGFIDIGETAERAAIREVFEEIGISIDNLEFVATFPNQYLYQNIVIPVLDIFFSVQIDQHGPLRLAADEVSEVVQRTMDEDTLAEICFDSNRLALELVAAKLRRE